VNRWLERVMSIAVGQPGEFGPPRRTVIRPTPSLVVVPPPRFAWDEKGWRRVVESGATHYVGSYRVRDRRRNTWSIFDGRLIEDQTGLRAYVADPPPELKTHPKGPCFQLTRPPWFRVHWHTPPENIDQACLYVESILKEALDGRRR
jgi:hypothetical protein